MRPVGRLSFANFRVCKVCPCFGVSAILQVDPLCHTVSILGGGECSDGGNSWAREAVPWPLSIGSYGEDQAVEELSN